MKKFFKKSPDALVVVGLFLILIAALTWILPAGAYDREVVNGKTMVVPGTYKTTDSNPQGIFDVLTSPVKGIVSAAQIIAFVLLVGGAFSMVTATGALDSALQKVIAMAQTRPRLRKWIIPLLMTIFSIAGCTFGMAEETLVFILITLPLARTMGYDSVVGIAIPFLGAGAGFAGAALNPFTVGIAQGIAEVPLFSGWEYRWFVWAVYTIIAIVFVMIYVRKLEKDPKNSIVYGLPSFYDTAETPLEVPFDGKRKIIVVLFILALALLMYGASSLDWYIEEIAALFITLGILAAIISSLNLEETVKAFVTGAKDMLAAALIIGLSKSILVVAEDGMIIDTILHNLTSLVQDFPPAVSVQVMFITQALFNIIVPSGSGQAAITMPVMTPLADILGISRQTAVLAYQFGDGLLNLVIPTSGVTMGILGMAKIPYNVWVKWMWPMIAVTTVASMILLALPETLFSW